MTMNTMTWGEKTAEGIAQSVAHDLKAAALGDINPALLLVAEDVARRAALRMFSATVRRLHES